MTDLPDWTPAAWARLGNALRAEREAQHLSRRSLAEIAHVSQGSIQSAEDGRVPQSRWPQSLRPIERALSWVPGSAEAILNGMEPPRVAAQSPAAEAPATGATVEIPADLFADLVAIAAHISAGRSAAFVQERPYPDALARRTLDALDDAGLLPNRHPDKEQP